MCLLPPQPLFPLSESGLSQNPESTELYILARLADGECPEFLHPHLPVLRSQACTAKASFCTWMPGVHVQFLILGQQTPYSLNYIPNLMSIVFFFYV